MTNYHIITIPDKWYLITLISTCTGAFLLLLTALVSVVFSLYAVSEGIMLVLAHVSSTQLVVMQAIGLGGYTLIKKYNQWRKESLGK